MGQPEHPGVDSPHPSRCQSCNEISAISKGYIWHTPPINQVRLLKSEITGRYIIFGCSNQPSSIKPINLGKAKKITQNWNPSNPKQIKNKGTPSPLLSTGSETHQPKQHKIQQSKELPHAQSLHKQDKITREVDRTAKGENTQKTKALSFQL